MSHGEKWIKLSMDNEHNRAMKEVKKLEKTINMKTERLEEVKQQLSKPPKVRIFTNISCIV